MGEKTEMVKNGLDLLLGDLSTTERSMLVFYVNGYLAACSEEAQAQWEEAVKSFITKVLGRGEWKQ